MRVDNTLGMGLQQPKKSKWTDDENKWLYHGLKVYGKDWE